MINRPKLVAGIQIPDGNVATQATELLLEHGTEFLYNHSMRVFVFSSLKAKQAKIVHDSELMYVSAVFHDLGLTPRYSSPDKRFEVDSANAARDFLKTHGLSPRALQLVWDAVALHTTVGIAPYKEAEVALVNYGVSLDVVGNGYEDITDKDREEIIHHFPRTDFKRKIIPTFFEGFKHKTETTYGNINADICAYMIPNFKRKDFCESILHSPWRD